MEEGKELETDWVATGANSSQVAGRERGQMGPVETLVKKASNQIRSA
jgi:hypothetical protein